MRRLILMALFAAGCDATVGIDVDETEPAADPECLPEPLQIQRAEVCYDDEAACPQDVPGAPWEAVCGRAYMCEFKQPDDSWAWVCTRARDCECLEEWADCTGDDVPVPGYCSEAP